jgi:hypothetical protein
MQQNATPYSYFIINDQYNAACVGRTVACFHSQGVQDPRFFWWVADRWFRRYLQGPLEARICPGQRLRSPYLEFFAMFLRYYCRGMPVLKISISHLYTLHFDVPKTPDMYPLIILIYLPPARKHTRLPVFITNIQIPLLPPRVPSPVIPRS